MKVIISVILLFAALSTALPHERGTVVINDSIRFPAGHYVTAYLDGISGGSQLFTEGGLNLLLYDAGKAYGVYNKKTVSGHFYAEIKFDSDKGASLALIKETNGLPDFNNFTSLSITTENNIVWVSVHDRQNGVDDVLDFMKKAPVSSYSYPLSKDRFSVNVDKSNGKIRIFHDSLANTWHFYYGIRKLIDGKFLEGWIEMKPSPDWNSRGTSFFVMPFVRSTSDIPSSVLFSQLKVMNKPTHDIDDTETGFKVTNREIVWSGFSGEGIVLTFGKHCSFARDNAKFIFWSEANYVPGWHLNNQIFAMNEFVEQGLSPKGCEEPMADRLLRWSKVEVVEDNAVRKTVHWQYVLCNPEYRTVEEDIGTEKPIVDEYYSFYPDGTGIRKIIFKPKMDGNDFGWFHDIGEIHVTAGSTSIPDDHLSSPALSIANLQGIVHQYEPDQQKYEESTYQNWEQIMFVTHFKEVPDPYIVYSHTPEIPETYSHYKITTQKTWHSRNMAMTHFPVNREQYDNDVMSNATWARVMPIRTSLANIVVNVPKNEAHWPDNFEIDNTDGRKYRKWIAMLGLTPNDGDLSPVKNSTQTWLYPGSVVVNKGSLRFISNDVSMRQLVFNHEFGNELEFILDPTLKQATIVNPVFCIKNWDVSSISVKYNKKQLVQGIDYEFSRSGNNVLVWVKARSDSPMTFNIDSFSE